MNRMSFVNVNTLLLNLLDQEIDNRSVLRVY